MRIAFQDQYEDYRHSLIPAILAKVCGGSLQIADVEYADLVIVGPLRRRLSPYEKVRKWMRKTLRRRAVGPLRLFHTGENIRHDSIAADYAISFDLCVSSDRHFRLPLWMESIDWAHEGVIHRSSPRVSRLLSIDSLTRPLGTELFKRPWRAALFTSHMNEPRRTLFDALSKVMPTQGFGRPFDPAISGHSSSGISKDIALRDFAVNLCPENSLYPGYYTEKVVEAFGFGCLPVTWADPNLSFDFNPGAVVNCLDFAAIGNERGLREALTREAVQKSVDLPLLRSSPTIEPLIEFLRRVVGDVR